MKIIVLVRHGKAERCSKSGNDFDRRLTKKGEKNSVITANKLAKHSFYFDMLISSPAKRAKETAVIFANELNYPVNNINYHDTMYFDMTLEGFLKIICNIDNKIRTIAVFGHNPFLTELATSLSDIAIDAMEKSSVLGMKFNCSYWDELPGNPGKISFYYTISLLSGKNTKKFYTYCKYLIIYWHNI
ncbi:MAG: histidine phosphatase family protein [Bacteroidota bacterium]